MGTKEVRELEDTLAAAAAMVPTPQRGDPFRFFDVTYPYLVRSDEQARADVAKLGMTTDVEHAIAQCRALVEAGQSGVAADLLFEVCGQLREKSGTFAKMKKMYKAPARH